MKPAAPSETQSMALDTRCGPVGVAVEGSGPTTVLMVHGLPGSCRDFRWITPPVSEFARVIRVDLPGFGLTPRLPGPQTSEARSEVLSAVLDALGVEAVFALGHSQGGAVVSALAAVDARVTGAGFVASVGLRRHRLLRQSPPLGLVTALMGLPLVSGVMRRVMYRGFVEAGFPRSLTLDEVELSIRSAAAMRLAAHAERIRSLTVPTLVAYAEDDGLIEPAIGEELGAAAPAGPRLRFPTGGHNLQKTRAVELAAALREMLT